nr:MAG TPA: hypothetical protein [Caudoviricetes sp.]
MAQISKGFPARSGRAGTCGKRKAARREQGRPDVASLQEISRAVRECAGEGLTSTSPAQASAGKQVFHTFPVYLPGISRLSRTAGTAALPGAQVAAGSARGVSHGQWRPQISQSQGSASRKVTPAGAVTRQGGHRGYSLSLRPLPLSTWPPLHHISPNSLPGTGRAMRFLPHTGLGGASAPRQLKIKEQESHHDYRAGNHRSSFYQASD